MQRPGGQPIPFWLAVKTTSMPHASNWISSEPTLQTPSITTRVSGLTWWTISETFLISLSTPVEVSTCVMVISLYFLSFNAFSISGSWGLSPMGAFSCVALTPYVSKQSVNESAKYPVCRTKTSSPRSARLAATISQPRVPLPEMTKG